MATRTKAQLQDRIDELEVQLQGVEEELAEVRAESEKLQEENDRLEGKIEDRDGEIADLEEKLTARAQNEYLAELDEMVEFVDFHRPHMGKEMRERFDKVSYLRSMSRD